MHDAADLDGTLIRIDEPVNRRTSRPEQFEHDSRVVASADHDDPRWRWGAISHDGQVTVERLFRPGSAAARPAQCSSPVYYRSSSMKSATHGRWSTRSAYSTFCLNVGYPLFDRIRGRRLMSRYAELLSNESRRADEIRELQWTRLREIVDHAASTTPYYQDRFRVADMPLRDISELAALPILRKRDIQANGDALVSTAFDRRKLVAGRTGGSTGEPTRFFHDVRALDYIRAATLRNLRWAGYEVGAKVVKVSGSHFDYTLAKKAGVRFTAAILRQRWMPAIDLSADALDSQLIELRRWRPDFFWGYASALHTIARRLLHRGEQFPVRAVITSSDNLTADMREAISAAFDAPVFDAYGSREMSIGAECERHAGLHINTDVLYLEVVNDHGTVLPAGQSGRIVVTDLVNYGFPLIRYEIGDRGSLAANECSCGRPFPLLAALDGRSDDFIVRSDGARISPPAFTVLMSDFPQLSDYRIHQRADGTVDVHLVTTGAWTNTDERHLRVGLQTILGASRPYRVMLVESIDYGESGKRRAVISDVREPRGHQATTPRDEQNGDQER